jgi:Holliday junction resolvase
MDNKGQFSELLAAGALSGGLPALLSVPDPFASTVSVDNIAGTTGQLFGLLGAVVNRQEQLARTTDGNIINTDSPEWAEAFRKVVAFVTLFLKDNQVREKFFSETIEKPSMLSFSAFMGSPEEPGLADTVRYERILIWSFLLGLSMSRITALMPRMLSSIMPHRPEDTVLSMISSLASEAVRQDDVHASAAAAMVDCLSFAFRRDMQVREEKEEARLKATANSFLQVYELSQLATQTGRMREKYGPKDVEARFEQQLSLALQTCGFRTVPASRGARRGDIICVNDRNPPAAILVEAKTSAHPYKLPVRDERALIEYAQQLNASSWIAYPLKLICIIGPEPDRNIADRLKRIEMSTQVPTRYCDIKALVGLLARPPVGVTTNDIIEELVGADRVVSADDLTAVSTKAEEKLAVLRAAIEKFLE